MKLKVLIFAGCLLFFAGSLSAQNKDKRKQGNRHEKGSLWNKKIMRGGKDTRFTKHRRRHYLKPGQDSK